MILYCQSGLEAYPVSNLSAERQNEWDTPLEFTKEEADKYMKVLNDYDDLQRLIDQKLEAARSKT